MKHLHNSIIDSNCFAFDDFEINFNPTHMMWLFNEYKIACHKEIKKDFQLLLSVTYKDWDQNH